MTQDRQPQITLADSAVSRRDFIQGAAAIAAAMGVSLTYAAEAQERREAALKESRPVNCGIIGVGTQGYGQIFKSALSVPGVKMVAVCDIYEPNLQRALKDVPGAQGYKDYRALLDRPDIEAVLIATPLYLHAPIAIDALKAGKQVFCEKMMAYDIPSAKAMARAALDAKKILQIGHQRRADVLYNHAWEMIHSAKVCGKITHIRAQWNRNGSWRRTPVPKDTNDRHWNWRLYKEYSQGLMAELGTHQIHAVNWFLGAVPTAVIGMGGIDYWKDGRTVYDNVMVLFEYPNNVRFAYTSLTTNQYDGYYEQFMGDEGTLIISEDRKVSSSCFREPRAQQEDWMKSAVNKETGQRGQSGLKLDPEATKKLNQSGVKVGERTLSGSVAGKSSYLLELEDFFNSIRTGSPVTCDWKEALGCTVAACRANEAIARGTRIEIKPSDYTL
jgi:predicted dehydrogenase